MMAAGGLCGDAAGGRSSRSGLRWPAQRAPPVRPLRGCSLSCRGGIIAARPAMMRCAHGRLAQRLRSGRAVYAISVGRKVCGERRMAAAAVLQRTVPAAAGGAGGRPEHANLAREGLRVASSASGCSGEKLRHSLWKNACLRARCARFVREMGPPNLVCYVGTKAPGSPGFS